MKFAVRFNILLIIFNAVSTTQIAIHSKQYPEIISTPDLPLFLNTLRSTQKQEFCPFSIIEYHNKNVKTLNTHQSFHNHSETYTSVRADIIEGKAFPKYLDSNSKPALQLLLRKYQNHCDTIVINFAQHVQLDTFAHAIPTIGRKDVDHYIFVSAKVKLVQNLFKALPPKRLKYVLGVILSSKQTTQDVTYFHNSQSVTKNRVNLNGVILKITSLHIPPVLNMKNNQIIGGTMYNLHAGASKNFNFTFDVHLSLDGSGRLLSNGTWVGMVGDLLYHRSDLAAIIRVTPPRYGLIDVANYLWNGDDLIFITSLPQKRIPWAAIFQPFTLFLWVVILVALGAMTLALFFAMIITTLQNTQHDPHSTIIVNAMSLINEHYIKYTYSLLITTIVICLDQGAEIQKGTKILVMIWLLSILVIGTGYKDKLFAALTAPDSEVVPRTAEELHARLDYRVIFHYWKRSHFNRMNNSENQMHKDLVKRFILEPDIAKCVLMAVFEPKTVCVGGTSVIKLTLASNATLISAFEVAVLSDSIFLNGPMYISVGLQRRSIYLEDISKIVSMFRDGGFMEHWGQQELSVYKVKGKQWVKSDPRGYVYQKLKKLVYEYTEITKPLQISNFVVIFCICFVCILCAAVIFVLEIY
ncbi:unnamed protein product [Allacma fusca]|uniref:Uncharacterized protein n=1 Tax=Allacma fusca TaxID=39272 RepID=A0A8J2PT38_9HEXA|nr:unnamed protein product [Allacma fusca]